MIEISVLMCVYNMREYIDEAIKSILNQTFKDFELIIVDDGSVDGTLDIVRSYVDDRIKIIQNEHNYIASLNMGLKAVSGKYIARMDADDIMHVDRLRLQHAFMDRNPSLVVCSSWMKPFGKDVDKGVQWQTVNGYIQDPLLALLRNNILFNPTVMIRRSFLINNKLVYNNVKCAEDYRLWVDIAKSGGTFYVIPTSLVYYRISSKNMSKQNIQEREKETFNIRKEILYKLLEERLVDASVELKRIFTFMEIAVERNIIPVNLIFSFFYKLLKEKN